MANKKDKKLVVLLINGLGVSFGWKGNAVLASEPKSFSELWTNSRRVFLSPTRHCEEVPNEPVNRDLQYLRFGSGQDLLTGKEILDQFAEKELARNTGMLELIEYAKRHNSQLRLLSVITSSDLRTQTKIIEKSLLLAKSNNFFNISIDFILGEGFHSVAELAPHLTRIESIVTHAHVGSIASFSGAGFIQNKTTDKKKLSAFFDNFENCSGKRYLSISQFIERNKRKDPFLVEPSLILPDEFRQAKLSSFSSILFSSSLNSPYSSLLSIIAKASFHHLKHMKMSLMHNAENLEFKNMIIDKHLDRSLNRNLRNHGYQTAIISEDYRAFQLRQGLFYDGKPNASFLMATPDKSAVYISNVGKVNQEIFRKGLSLIKEQKYDLILIDLPSLERVSSQGSFNKTVEIFKRIDDFLAPLKAAILESGYSLILSSFYGGVEKMIVKKLHGTEESYCETTKSPLPLLYIEDNTKKSKNLKLHEMAQISGQVASLNTTILDYFGIAPDDPVEKSVFSQLVTKEN